MRNMKKWMAVLLGLLTLASAAGLAETVSLANELTYVESVEYKGNGIFEIEFMRNVAWRDDFVLTGTDEAGGPLVVSSLGGDASEMFVQVEGGIADDALVTFHLVGESGVIPAVGQATLNFKYANYCEYCLEFGHAEMVCGARVASNARENDRCDLCGTLGHDDDYCPERKTGTLYCDECGKTGHDEDYCVYDDDDRYDFCDYCGSLGHDDDYCPDRISVTPANNTSSVAVNTGSANVDPAVSATPRPEYCDECGKYGHDDDHCPNERCDECGKTGHDDDHCPNERCDECGEYGHDDDHCPNERCDECGKTGHDDDHCPNRKHHHSGKHHD